MSEESSSASERAEPDRTEPKRGTGRLAVAIGACLLLGAGSFALGRSTAPTEARQMYSELPRRVQHELDDPRAAAYMRGAFADIVRRRDLAIPPNAQKQIATLFHGLAIWREMWFMGIRIQKNPCDLWMMQQIIYEVRPDYIIEAGTFRGGSALYFAHMLDGMGLHESKVITVDIENQAEEAAKLPLWKKYVEFHLGSSTDPAIVGRIRDEVEGSRVLVVLDSDHSRDHVLSELVAYAPLVSTGSYAVVEDTNLDGIPLKPPDYRGPMAAVVTFLSTEEGSRFRQDLSREAMVLTFNPGGWLKKVAQPSS